MNEIKRYKGVIAILVPVVLALALAGVCIWASEQQRAAEAHAVQLENHVQTAYRQAYYQLSDNVNDMQTALRKLQVTGSPSQHVLLLADVWRLSGAAAANMGNIPVAHADTADMNAFIVRVGDYAHVLAQRILNGGVLTQDDYETIGELYEAGVRVGNEIKSKLDGDAVPVQALDADGYYGGAEPGAEQATGGERGGAANGGEDTGNAGANTQTATNEKSEDAVSDYPTLIYDGPFSESNETAKPRGLPDGEIDAAKAREIALSYIGGGTLQDTGLEAGTIPVFGFAGSDRNGRGVEITVSQQGGAVLWMMAEVSAGEDGVPDADTTKRMRDEAKAYLDKHGYAGMEATYAQFYDGVGVFNFAATQNNVILYGDLIKVYVERATGAVCGVDANNYLMFHCARQLAEPAITQEEAAANVSERLQVESVRLALIPKTNSTEALCYEFKGTHGGTSFIVYINALTGTEEQIFEIIDSEDGQLVV